jgi:K+-transporting ATPase ATPase A chain
LHPYTFEEGSAVRAGALLRVSLFLVVLTLISKPLGVYVYKVMEGVPTWAGRLLGPLERAPYRCCRVDPRAQMTWKVYFTGLLIFNAVGAAFLYLLLWVQAILLLNPSHWGPVSADSAFNTAISFATNTSWQDYAGETTLGNLAQMIVISSQSFLSAATGIAALMALLLGAVLVIGGLTYMPALALGPIAESLQVPALAPPNQH